MITLAPFDNLGAMAVLSRLDPSDLIEAHLVRGVHADHLTLFADWRGMQAQAVLSLVLKDDRRGGKPFAVLALSNTGQAGVAQAALLARDHAAHWRALATAALMIRAGLPEYCAEWGIYRIEARCWAGHPSAARFLTHCGFAPETDMPGFGPDGTAIFRQFAWITPPLEGS